MINKLTIIGVGLIGGSLARALKRAQVCTEIVGCGRNALELQSAVHMQVIDRYETDPATAVRDADVIVVAVHLGVVEAVLRQIAAHVKPGAVLTDVGSVKLSVIEAARAAFGEVPANFVPGHPIAGAEKKGVAASQATLFEHARVVLTPLATTQRRALATVRALWEATGAEVVEMDARQHDETLAATSHLPHLLAYTLMDMLARRDKESELLNYAAGGLRDVTRIAASEPQMWHDISLANRDALVPLLDEFGADLHRLADALREGNSARIKSIFMRAKVARDRLYKKTTP